MQLAHRAEVGAAGYVTHLLDREAVVIREASRLAVASQASAMEAEPIKLSTLVGGERE